MSRTPKPQRHWTNLLLASRLAMAPSRVGLAFGALLAIGLVAHVPDLWNTGSGSADTPARMLSECGARGARELVDAALGLRLGDALAALLFLLYETPKLLLTHFPWTTALFAPILALPWTIAGGAISRSAAERLALGHQQKPTRSLAFALSRPGSLLFALLTPILVAALAALPLAALGYLMLRVPGVNLAGGIFFGVLQLLALFLVLALAGFGLAHFLLVPAVACDGVDALDAVQRSYAYVVARPFRAVGYVLLLVGQGVALLVVLALVKGATVQAAGHLATIWLPGDVSYIYRDAATSSMLHDTTGTPFGTGGTASIIAIWSGIPSLLVAAIMASFYFCGSTLLYLTLRHDCDGQDPRDLWQPGLVPGISAQPGGALAEGDEDDD